MLQNETSRAFLRKAKIIKCRMKNFESEVVALSPAGCRLDKSETDTDFKK